MARTYLLLIFLAGLFGAMIAQEPEKPSANGIGFSKEEKRPEGSKESSSSEPPQPGTIELKREADGHFYANVEINGLPIRALVDTGASAIALSRQDARSAGLAVSAGMFEVVGQGASGEVRGEFTKLDKVTLGHKNAEHLPAIILDSGDISLLGQSFLSRFDSVEINGDTMSLR